MKFFEFAEQELNEILESGGKNQQEKRWFTYLTQNGKRLENVGAFIEDDNPVFMQQIDELALLTPGPEQLKHMQKMLEDFLKLE